MYIHLNVEALVAAGFSANSVGTIYFEHGVSAYAGPDGARIEVKCDILQRPSIPFGIKPEWITHITFKEFLPDIPRRRRGVYRLHTAVLTAEKYPSNRVYTVGITSATIANAQEIFWFSNSKR